MNNNEKIKEFEAIINKFSRFVRAHIQKFNVQNIIMKNTNGFLNINQIIFLKC